MKKIIVITCLAFFASTMVFAQTSNQGTQIEGYKPGSPEAQAKDRADELNKTVGLNPEQYNKVMEINKKFFEQVQVGGNTPAARIADDRENQIKAILTPAQLQKLDKAKTNKD